jgi:hypothetical protein
MILVLIADWTNATRLSRKPLRYIWSLFLFVWRFDDPGLAGAGDCHVDCWILAKLIKRRPNSKGRQLVHGRPILMVRHFLRSTERHKLVSKNFERENCQN